MRGGGGRVGAILSGAIHQSPVGVGGYGPATLCDAAYPRPMGRSEARVMHQNRMRCIFQHVGNLAPNFRISQLSILRFLSGFQQNGELLILFHMICELNPSVEYY